MSITFDEVERVSDLALEYRVELADWYYKGEWTLLVTDANGDYHVLMISQDKAAVEDQADRLVQAFHEGALMADRRWITEMAPDY